VIAVLAELDAVLDAQAPQQPSPPAALAAIARFSAPSVISTMPSGWAFTPDAVPTMVTMQRRRTCARAVSNASDLSRLREPSTKWVMGFLPWLAAVATANPVG
jgi:hypothetical protein